MRGKRRKKLAKLWAEFQQLHGLSDQLLKQARSIGNKPDALQEALNHHKFDESTTVEDRIRRLHQQKQEHLATIQPEPANPCVKKKKGKTAFDPMWAKAKQVCRLNKEDIRMAKDWASDRGH